LYFRRGRPGEDARFEPVPHPIANASVLNVLKFRANGAGVNLIEQRDHFAQPHLTIIEKEFGRNRVVEILVAKSEFAQAEQWVLRPFFRQWIYARDGVTENAIGVNERIDARLQRTFAQFTPRFGGYRFNCRAIFAVEVPELESFKKGRPTRIDRIGIFLPTLVILLEQIEIQASGE